MNRLEQYVMQYGSKVKKYGLDTMKRLSPKKLNFQVIHVAGTNGKGSVCWKIAKVLEKHKYKVGLFVSPHIHTFHERIQINGQYITDAQMDTLLPGLYQRAKNVPVTFFELTTLLALDHFEKEKVDVVVLETGLGGRLDATNIVSNPLLCIITSIGLDHTHILGNSISKIATEKAGIFKPNAHVLVGQNTPAALLHKLALQQQCRSFQHVQTAACQDFIQQNTNLAKAAIDCIQTAYHRGETKLTTNHYDGLESLPPARFEIWNHYKVPIVVDIAHNPPAVESLIHKVKSTFPRKQLKFICGFSVDKNIQACIQVFEKHAAKVYFVRAEDNKRAAQVDTILQCVPRESTLCYESIPHIPSAIKRAVDESSQSNIIVICGSAYIMHQVYNTKP